MALVIILLVLTACGPDATPETMLQPTSLPKGVTIVSIVEGNDSIRTVEETRTFDQCNASSLFKLNISIGQSETTESAQELVLRASVGGEVGISAVAKVAVQGGLEQHYHERKAQTIERSEAPQIEVPAHTKQQYRLVWNDRRATGTITYIENDETKTAEYDYRLGYQLVDSKGDDLECDAAVVLSISTATSYPTNTPYPTYTPYPTNTPMVAATAAMPTPEPEPTDTPGPSPTPKNTDLAIGESYTNGSVSIRPTNVEFTEVADSPVIRLTVYIKNISNNQISFEYTQNALGLTDNTGRSFTELYWGDGYLRRMTLVPGQEERLEGYYPAVTFKVDHSNPIIDRLLFSVRGVSSVDDAEWVIPVYH